MAVSNLLNEKWFSDLEIELPGDVHVPNRIFRCRPNSDDIDFSKPRPFKKFKTNELREFCKLALLRPWSAIELATLIYDEAKHRVDIGGSEETFQIITTLFKQTENVPIPWLTNARKALKEKTKYSRTTDGNASVYFVLVSGFTETNQYYGCYVGQTMTTQLDIFSDNQSARIAKHFAGIRAATSVKTRGIEPLWSLNHFTLNIADTREEIENLETSFHRSLEPVVPRVLGDTND